MDGERLGYTHLLLSFVRSGLRWHPSGLSELPLQRLLFTCRQVFSFSLCFRRLIPPPQTFCFGGPIFRTMYEHIVVEYLLHCSTASTVQHNTAISPHKAAKQVRADQSVAAQASRQRASTLLRCLKHSTAQSARTKPRSKYVPMRVRQMQACTQSWRETEDAVECLYSTLSSPNERRNRNLPGLQKVQLLTQRSCDARRICR